MTFTNRDKQTLAEKERDGEGGREKHTHTERERERERENNRETFGWDMGKRKNYMELSEQIFFLASAKLTLTLISFILSPNCHHPPPPTSFPFLLDIKCL